MLRHMLLRCCWVHGGVLMRLRRCPSARAPSVQSIHRFANLRHKHARHQVAGSAARQQDTKLQVATLLLTR